MLRYVIPVLAVSVASVYGAQEYLKSTEDMRREQNAPKPTVKQVAKAPQPKQEAPLYGRKARIEMDSRGHFVTTAKMNGRSVEVLVDTGATSVAINRKTARRLGINLKQSDFKYKVNTANGVTRAASVQIDRIQIGRINVRNVNAAVLDDNALKGTLLGMSFLGQLKSFEVKNRQLVLSQ